MEFDTRGAPERFREQIASHRRRNTVFAVGARQLYHSRDIGEPFDFLTWFEYAPQHSEAFEELVRKLRNTEEWRFVDREVDIRLERD